MTGHLPRFVTLSLFLHGALLVMLAGGTPDNPGQRPGPSLLPVSLEQPATNTSPSPLAATTKLLHTQVSAVAASMSSMNENSTTASPAESAAQPKIDAAGRQLREALHRSLLPHFYYPLLARAQGWQGEALFAVHVAADGQLSHLQLVRSSGYAVLDRAALDSLGKIRELPEALQYELGAPGMTLRIPVVYKLTQG